MADQILIDLALEGREVLIAHGLDPDSPPNVRRPPADAVFAEYQKRGGTQYTDKHEFTSALVETISHGGPDAP